MNVTPDSIIYFQWGFITINATIVFTWVVMVVIVTGALTATVKLQPGTVPGRWQSFLETVVGFMRGQVRDVMDRNPDSFLPFLGTLFLLISVSNFLTFVPGYHPPTGSLSTTAALAMCVFFAVPVFGIAHRGFGGYFKHYIQPSVFMLPFHIIGEFSRTLSMAVRLFGNIMSGSLIAGVLISLAPLFVPIIMEMFGLLIGQIQAYIFFILATVYVASSSRTSDAAESHQEKEE
ncbi:MAG: F0F1 ATP synthase subunit A [Elusimicrobia bacterium]|nr:F0F1 ATP synthase subunit A [Elusimicrobiota bacterium]MBD3411493.1 F0F1 ATP synthase subunit A [Elusimicrobiota bacterium]